jgi:hypothetical protein
MTERRSGYDAETGICWNFWNKGDSRWYWDHQNSCPVCSAPDKRQCAMFGRCRSGHRWFWVARGFDGEPVYGYENAEERATAAAINAVHCLKTQPLMHAIFVQGVATQTLKERNEAKRRERPASDASDAHVVEYLYSYGGCYSDGMPCGCEELTGAERIFYHTAKFQILRKTKKRVYYIRKTQPFLDDDRDPAAYGNGYVNRLKLEAEGEVYNRGRHWSTADFHLYRSVELPLSRFQYNEDRQAKPDLAVLKAEMAAAHPDRSGSNEAFIAARSRYVEARRSMRSAGIGRRSRFESQ